MAALQLKTARQLIRLLNSQHSHTKAGSKDSIPISVSSHKNCKFTEILDVRTPDEYQTDHIPGSKNIPVLTNEERIIVGTLYAQNQFEARKKGAALIAQNISRHINEHFLSKPREYSPLVYCWRGGQRSHSIAMVLSQIGFQTYVFEGGYMKYRLHVRDGLKSIPEQFQYRVISGMTGSGKTHILNVLKQNGEQVLDLEALAKHKGSLLGLWHNETQPSQKFLESNLLYQLEQFSSERPIWVESESKRIGSVTIPDVLFSSICSSPRYCITLPMEERVKHIIQSYPNWVEDTDQLKELLDKFPEKVVPKKLVKVWHEMIDKREGEKFVQHMLENHYDPTYQYSQRKNNVGRFPVEECCIPNLNEDTVQDLVHVLTAKEKQSFRLQNTQAHL